MQYASNIHTDETHACSSFMHTYAATGACCLLKFNIKLKQFLNKAGDKDCWIMQI